MSYKEDYKTIVNIEDVISIQGGSEYGIPDNGLLIMTSNNNADNRLPILKHSKRKDVDNEVVDKLNNIAVMFNNISNTPKGTFSNGILPITEPKKTFKLFGMDIDENFNAVIKVKSGNIIVNNLISTIYAKIYYSGSINLDKEQIRYTITKLKTESLYDIYRDVQYISDTLKSSANKEDVCKDRDKLIYSIDNIKDVVLSMYNSDSDINTKLDLPYTSVSMNIINGIKKEFNKSLRDSDMVDGYESNNEEEKEIINYLSSVMNALVEVKDIYEEKKKWLQKVQLATEYKSIIEGDKNAKALCSYVDDESANDFLNKLVNNNLDDYTNDMSSDSVIDLGGVLDGYADEYSYDIEKCLSVVKDAYSAASSFDTRVLGQSDSYAAEDGSLVYRVSSSLNEKFIDAIDNLFEYGDMLRGNLSSDDYVSNDDVDTLQSLSVIDSLRYLDDDFYFASTSYDMNDENQVSMLYESIIDSYRRNFLDLKKSNINTVDAIMNIVDNGDINGINKIFKGQENLNVDADYGYVLNDKDMYSNMTEKDNALRRNLEILIRILKISNKVNKELVREFSNQ